MSALADLEADIRLATEAVARAERAAAAHREYPSVFVTLKSAEKYRDTLIERFEAEISRLRISACSYRVEYEHNHNPAISGITSAINIFQEIYTNIYHVLKNGVRQRAKPAQASIDATRLNFAFTFPGSVGFMMTLDKEQELFKDSTINSAMSNTLKLLSAPDSETLDGLTAVIGLPSVRLTHKWAAENAKYGFGADIKWTLDPNEIIEARIQPSEVTHLAGVLGQYIAKERVRIVAILQNVNMFDRTFEMSAGDRRIVGSFDKAISEEKPAMLPRTYIANLTVATRVASEDVTYHLDSLEGYDPSNTLGYIQSL